MNPAPDHPTSPQASRSKRRLRAGLLASVGLLYVASVPWYRASGRGLELLGGLPDWVSVALGCYVLAALLNCAAWWVTDVDDTRDVSDMPSAAADPAVDTREGASDA